MGAASGCGASPTPRRRLDRIGLQLYTVRKQMEVDLPGTLARVAAIGYKEVEFANEAHLPPYFGKPPVEIRDILAGNGLTSPSIHVPLKWMRKEWRKVLDDARQVGHQWVVMPWLEEEDRPKSLDAWQRLAAELGGAARAAREAGLRFAYHNHDFELTPIPAAGTNAGIPLDILIAETDAALVEFELDVYWIVKAGGNPASYISRLGKRMPLIHLKDSSGPPSHEITEIGRGSIDFRRILADGNKSIKHYYVEHDNPADPLAAARISYDYLKTLEY
jgi:sugar phosphate isomerase/epimerase